MKKIVYALACIIVCLLCGCSESLYPSISDGDKVSLTLGVSDASPREITVNTRATDAEERKLDNLYIYVFNANGQLKGFKGITDAANLNQNTNDNTRQEITIKTRAGSSYVYAVANVNTGLYPITTSNGSIEEGKLPIGLNEDKVQAGEYASFTLEKLKALPFVRNNANSIQISSAFLMSGAVNEGKTVTITDKGDITEDNKDIRLSRIVSKVKFTIKAKTESGVTCSFKLSSYDIMNIALNGSLVGTIDGNTRKEINDAKNISNITGSTRGVNDVDDEGREFFEVYLPENLQTAKKSVSSWNAREDDSQSTEKTFTNAPEYGTYVILKGRYEETSNVTTKSADVKYYVHLGDCSKNFNDYNVERNCKYTFNITVAGVDKIIVEAEKKGNEQPGAEGVVLEYGSTGKSMILDSHYEYMVMRFYQNDIQQLKKNGLGYYYQVHELGKHTDVINVTDNTSTGNKNGVSTDWIQFAIKNGKTKSKYNSSATERGTACDYPGIQDIDKNTDGTGLYSIEMFLKLLYDKADTDDFWTSSSDTNGKYIDATCFVDENYYKKLTWDQYVNDVDLRKFYVANSVETSTDGRSVYAKAQYGLSQYNIQTFYDRSQSGSIVAYGCETINDEKRSDNYNGNNSANNNNDKWDGRKNFMSEYQAQNNGTKWSTWKNNKDLRYRCLSRNRDLNGDGTIDDNEARWYVPTSAQYAGLWIGEDVISTEAKLYNETTTAFNKFSNGDISSESYALRMLYYTNTNDEESFWSEEGMATGKPNDNTRFVRCIRNLKSNDIGYDQTPATYFTWDSKNKLITLDKVDASALNVTGETGELNEHTERQESNKPASKFYVADKNTNETTQANVYNGKFICKKNYSQGNKSWRVPNQREYCLMFLVAGNNNGLTKSDIKDTFVKTKFSGWPFRYSWYCNDHDLTMNPTTNGYVRCISPAK